MRTTNPLVETRIEYHGILDDLAGTDSGVEAEVFTAIKNADPALGIKSGQALYLKEGVIGNLQSRLLDIYDTAVQRMLHLDSSIVGNTLFAEQALDFCFPYYSDVLLVLFSPGILNSLRSINQNMQYARKNRFMQSAISVLKFRYDKEELIRYSITAFGLMSGGLVNPKYSMTLVGERFEYLYQLYLQEAPLRNIRSAITVDPDSPLYGDNPYGDLRQASQYPRVLRAQSMPEGYKVSFSGLVVPIEMGLTIPDGSDDSPTELILP